MSLLNSNYEIVRIIIMLDLIGSKFLSLITISQVNQDLLSLAQFDLFRNPVLEKMLKLSLNSKPIK